MSVAMKLIRYLDKKHVPYEIVFHHKSYTGHEAAASMDVPDF